MLHSSLFRLGSILFLAHYAFAATKSDWESVRKQIETTLHVPNPLPNIESKSYGQFSPAKGVAADRVSYATDYGLRIPAIVYHGAAATITKHPALIIVNGDGGDKSSWYAYWAGILYARAGAVVLTYDPLGEYERNSERRSNTDQHDEILSPDDMARRMTGLMVTDVLEGAAYLAGRRDVDAKRIAALGYSTGSFLTAVACAIDTRVRACVLTRGDELDDSDRLSDSKIAKTCEAIAYRSLGFLGDCPAVLYALNAKRGPTLIWSGSEEHGADSLEDARRRTIARLGSSKDIFDFGYTPGAGRRPFFLTKPVGLWLEDKLKFPNWGKKDIEAMPETRVLDWAAKNNVTTPGSLASEREEGGTMALGGNIPVVSRDDLHAIPEAVWESQRENYVYETWVERAKAAIRSGAP